MPVRKIERTDFQYSLLVFDENGLERREPDGTLLSSLVEQRVARSEDPVTDVFLMSHGWKGDVPTAIEQYDKWIGAMATLSADLTLARQQRAGFTPLIVGLHWPSLPWGDETIPVGSGGVLSGRRPEAAIETQIDAYASRIADTPKARVALRAILESACDSSQPGSLTSSMRDAYATLFAESGLGTGDHGGRPGADQEGFDPAAIIAAGREASGVSGLLGIGDELREALLMPLRQLSFWKMKDRARAFGETGGHGLLTRLQQVTPSTKFHLMGHSFGCIVVAATVAGAPGGPPLPRPVNSLFLVQGALSLWSFAVDIPHAPGTAGYFNRIVKQGLVSGPIVTTRSKYDTAVGRFYPLGAQLKKQIVLGEEYPAYGGIGAFGIRGVTGVADDVMQPVASAYNFRRGSVYNLDASGVIRNGEGAAGAHSDIAHPEVAHAFWAAALAEGPMVSITRAASAAVPTASVPDVLSPPMYRGGMLGAVQPTDTGLAIPQEPNSSELRWINAEFEDQTEPLSAGRWYTLAFDIDVTARDTASGAIVFGPKSVEEQLFPKGVDEVVLTVQLDSIDFEISDHARPLRVPRVGKSHTKARFDISPGHNGPATLTATVHKDGNFIQQMELTFDVGGARSTPVQVTGRGRPPSAISMVRPRNIGLSIRPGPGGYDCLVWGAVSAHARLPFDAAFLGSAIDAARSELLKVIMYRDASGESVFQTRIAIPPAASDFALKTLARAGALLLQKLFFGPGADAQCKAIGEFLRKSASEHATPLKLQILAETAPVPWPLLYLGDASAGAKLRWDDFIGMSHVIEQIPLQNTLTVCDPVIQSDNPDLAVGVNVNTAIDAQLGTDFIAQQHAFWANAAGSRKRLRATERMTRAQVMQALASEATPDQILYFYCHAQASGLADPGGPDMSSLVLSDTSVTLADLNLDAPTTIQLRGNPLVFINACESAEMSPTFYDGFVPYFMAKGSRGVVGTECKTPALFAVAWAKRFFERFFDGEPLGSAFLGLRREFLEKHGNPLGLLYAVHCDGDTQIQPAL